MGHVPPPPPPSDPPGYISTYPTYERTPTSWPRWVWWTLLWCAIDAGSLIYALSRLVDRK